MKPAAALASLWSTEHFMIATTMLAMGLFAVLTWDSTFLDRRDVLVLAPLPVRPRTIFLAKAAALGAALGLTTAALNGLPGIAWAMHFAPAHSGLLGGVRALAAYWIAALAGAAFVFCAVLTVQGMTGQLPRRSRRPKSGRIPRSAATPTARTPKPSPRREISRRWPGCLPIGISGCSMRSTAKRLPACRTRRGALPLGCWRPSPGARGASGCRASAIRWASDLAS